MLVSDFDASRTAKVGFAHGSPVSHSFLQLVQPHGDQIKVGPHLANRVNCVFDGFDPIHHVAAVVTPRFDAASQSNRDARRRQETPEIVEFALEKQPRSVILVSASRHRSRRIVA